MMLLLSVLVKLCTAPANHMNQLRMSFGTGVEGVRILDKDIEFHTSGFEPGHHIIHAPLDEDDECELNVHHVHWQAIGRL